MNASFQKRQSLVKTSLPILHKQMTENKSTLSETAIDFVRPDNISNILVPQICLSII